MYKEVKQLRSSLKATLYHSHFVRKEVLCMKIMKTRCQFVPEFHAKLLSQMQQANNTSIALIHSLRHSSIPWIALFALFPQPVPLSPTVCLSSIFYIIQLSSHSPHVKMLTLFRTAASQQISASAVATALSGQSLLPTKLLIYAHTFLEWIPTSLSLPTSGLAPEQA